MGYSYCSTVSEPFVYIYNLSLLPATWAAEELSGVCMKNMNERIQCSVSYFQQNLGKMNVQCCRVARNGRLVYVGGVV